MDWSTINDSTINELLDIFDKIYSHDHLLMIDKKLTPLINYLIPFKQFKQRGKFDKISWIEDSMVDTVSQQHQNIVILVDNATEVKIPHHSRVTLIIKNLTKSRLYELNTQYNLQLPFNSIINNSLSFIRSKNLKIYNWDVKGITINDVLTINYEANHVLTRYFNEPLYSINELSSMMVKLVDKFGIKINNIYAIGKNSKLLLKIFDTKKLEYLNNNMNNLQQEFYINNLRATHNLIVLERNLDYIPLVMNQLNYIGLIDDLVDIKLNLINLNDEQIKVNDELFENLKFLNFSLIGLKLNKLAKLLKNQYNSNKNDLNLAEIKKLIKNLSNLNNQQDLIKKHTNISEFLLNKIKLEGDRKYNEFEIFLNFENEIFTMNYKAQLTTLYKFLNMNLSEIIIINSIILISIINDGIKSKDFDSIKLLMMQNYGIDIIVKLDNILKYKLVKLSDVDVTGVQSNDDDIMGGWVEVYNSTYTLLNKFWSLHPNEEQDDSSISSSPTKEIISVNDYSSPNFTLPSSTVPLMIRIIESLFEREFLTYKPLNKITNQPSWENLSLGKMFKVPVMEIKPGELVTESIIVIIGGITYSEISCINYLNEKFKSKNLNHKLCILTNGIVKNGNLQHCLNE